MEALSPCTFAVEEESINRDFQMLSKKTVQDDFELSCCIHRYMDFLGRMEIYDAVLHVTLNFVKAAVIIENCTKAFSIKVDNLSSATASILETLIANKSNKKNPLAIEGAAEDGLNVDSEGGEPETAAASQPRRRRRVKDNVAEEDFFEIDNMSGLAGKSMNEPDSASDFKLRFLERNLNLFTKSTGGRKRVEVCPKKAEDKDESRLRDWVLNVDMMIVRELFSAAGMSDESRYCDVDGEQSSVMGDDGNLADGLDDWLEPAGPSRAFTPEHNNNEDGGGYSSGCSEASFKIGYQKRETLRDALVDVDQVCSEKLVGDVILSKKLRPGVTTRPPCDLCNSKKNHKKGGKKCSLNGAIGTLESYFRPHVHPIVTDPQHGLLPDEELYTLYIEQMKAVKHLRRHAARGPSMESMDAHNVSNFAGFDEDDDDDHIHRGGDTTDLLGNDEGLANGFELPLPHTDNFSMPDGANPSERRFDDMAQELNAVRSTKPSFESNKLLGMRTAEWHASLVDKIALSEQRGALNMDILAARIMSDFPTDQPNPSLSFCELVINEKRRDVPRFFLACLQLTNESNINIQKMSTNPLATDCMSLIRLRSTRVKELDDYNPDQAVANTSGTKRSHDEMESGRGESSQSKKPGQKKTKARKIRI